jgi:hypothetical protein
VSLYTVRFEDGEDVQASTPAGALALLRRGGARLVAGDRAALIHRDQDERLALWDALRDEDWARAGLPAPIAPGDAT